MGLALAGVGRLSLVVLEGRLSSVNLKVALDTVLVGFR